MRFKELLGVILATPLVLAACAPEHTSKLVGKWRVRTDCGIEEIELRADSTFYQGHSKRGDYFESKEGLWSLEPASSQRETDHVILANAWNLCDESLRSTPLRLEVNREWGQTVLVFDPDQPRFTRVR